MKKYITNTFLCCAIFLVLNQVPDLFSNPYYGNKRFSVKYEYFRDNQDRFNTLVLGSSRIYRSINPEVFDDLLSDYQTATFNFAAPAIFNPEIYYLYEKLLESVEAESLKYAFIELQPLNYIRSKKLGTINNYYWHNLKYLITSTAYTFRSNYSFDEKIELINSYSISYIFNTLFGHKALTSTHLRYQDRFLGPNDDGFYSLNDEMNEIGGDNGYRKRYKAFLKDPSVLEKKITIANKHFSERNYEQFINEVHLAILLELIEKSTRMGVHLVFIIPPKLDSYNELLALKERLPSEHILEIANPKEYPELYQADYSFDLGHLNEKGANLFSEFFANEFRVNCLQSDIPPWFGFSE
jgi:hypothetical protein